ncbi:hypothetical protein OPV22_024292 [Ensete ventricosum]|uniref:RRM domain-containing protein n=1 Tax=Ensete ventricosum TaxID=4639 RepID=A0AAV8QWB2_ENSVE|nr:hypothetical protein OPV22_024292 [Ensete ventricosum]
MATKKRKVDQEDELLISTAPNHAAEPLSQAHHQPVVYTPAPASDEEDGGEDDDDDDVGQLLEPLSRDQLVAILRTTASADPATLAEIRRVADLDPAHRKLFVHGLGWETTAEGLRAAFASYGDIDDCRVIVDKGSGRSKGYGFVLFRHRVSARRALRRPQKLIDNRMTSCQLASSGPSAPSSHHHNSAPQHHQNLNPSPGPASHQDNISRKIYVGNVHSDVDGGRLLAFFSHYGEIEEGPIGFDRHTGKPKGYALFVYKTVDGALRALEEPNKNFEGHLLHCQRATDNKSKAASLQNAAAPPSVASSTGALNGSGYAGTTSDMGLAQQAAMLGQGFMGMGGAQAYAPGMQPNAALLTLLAAAGQNPAAFGVTPTMLASLNPAFAAAFGVSGSQQDFRDLLGFRELLVFKVHQGSKALQVSREVSQFLNKEEVALLTREFQQCRVLCQGHQLDKWVDTDYSSFILRPWLFMSFKDHMAFQFSLFSVMVNAVQNLSFHYGLSVWLCGLRELVLVGA